MATKRLSEGVGKKIVEALKKQSEIEVNPVQEEKVEIQNEIEQENFDSFLAEEEPQEEFLSTEEEISEEQEETLESAPETFFEEEQEDLLSEENLFTQPQAAKQQFINYQQPTATIADNFVNELENFEIPSNIAVLKKLITQLPSGVTRHTGAQIIKQTMEALGISMKSVLQEAQQVQEGLNTSAKECQATIQEYKKHILSLEKQSQNHQRQYAALNELISLFIQTGR